MVFNIWTEKKVGEIINLKRGYDLPIKKRKEGLYPIISSSGVNGYHSEFKVEGPGVSTGRSGLLGKVHYTEDNFWPLNTSLYVEDFKGNYPKFIYYLLQVLDLKNYNAGSSVPTLNRNHVHLLNVNVPCTSLQKRIADLLFNFENKLELNNLIIDDLEQLAQTLFKRWFVDFEFPNENGEPYKSSGGKMVESELGMIPEGWRIKTLSEISVEDIVCGKTPRTKVKEYYGGNLPFITIPDMHNQTFAIKTERYLTEAGEQSQRNKTIPAYSICVSCIATPGLVVMTSEPSQTNQQINSIVPLDIDKYFVFLLMKNLSNKIIELGSGGSTTLNLNKTQFSKIKIIYPTEEMRIDFHKRVNEIFEMIINTQKENEILSSLRDTLLPKLLSGELQLPDTLEVTEDVPVS